MNKNLSEKNQAEYEALPEWWPECPYPKEVFRMEIEDYVTAIPDEGMRTAISGYLGRVFFRVTSKLIHDAMKEHLDDNHHALVEECERLREALKGLLDCIQETRGLNAYMAVEKAQEAIGGSHEK